MFDFDNWQEIYSSVKQHKLRTALTAFGVVWGIFMLVMLLGVGNALRYKAISAFGSSPQSLFIWSAEKTQLAYQGFDKGRSIQLTMEDKKALEQRLPEAALILEVNDVGNWVSSPYVSRGDKSDSFITRGVHKESADLQSLRSLHGRFINQLDYDERRKVAVIGKGVLSALFEPDENPVGQTIKINALVFKVVGVFEPKRSIEVKDDLSERIYIPNSTLQYSFNQVGIVGDFRIISKSGVDASALEAKALAILKERHHIHPEDKSAFGSFNNGNEFNKVSGLYTGINAFCWFVAVGTIVAGVIGVGNIMLIIVKERTREIGLRKALGATSNSIIAMVVQEGIVITSVAGYLGLVLGVLVLETLKKSAQDSEKLRFLINAEIDFNTALLAIVILIAVGFLAALLPAQKAARVNPIVALQDE